MSELTTLRIGLAAAKNLSSLDERLQNVERFLTAAASVNVAIVCFPEAYIPGLRGLDFEVPPHDQQRQESALEQIRSVAGNLGVAVIIGMEWETENSIRNVAVVVSQRGEIEGLQTKNQIPPTEEPFYSPGTTRRLFEVNGVPFGITICHEGWRFPESVRWAAASGAKIIFHPQLTGSDLTGQVISRWGDPESPYYEKAMIARGVESTVFFASVNNALQFQESATSLISPDGECLAYVPYGEEALLVYDIDLSQATGFYAQRLNGESYPALDAR